MSLLDTLLGRAERGAKSFRQISSPSPPPAPETLGIGEAGGDGDDARGKVFTSRPGFDSHAETTPRVPVPRRPEPGPYAERMRATLKQINRQDYPAGMILWLEKAHPRLYWELTEYLPEDIHRLWEAHVPLEEFEYTLERLVATHQRAVALYRESTSRSP